MTMRNLTLFCLTFAFVYLAHAERDFNFNDVQIPLLEPKDNQPYIAPHPSEHPYASEVLRCTDLENEILLSLVLKHHDWRDMSDRQRTKVLDKLSQFFAIPKEFITLETVSKRDLNEMFEESIRKGNNKCQNNNRRLGRVNLMIGCGGSYFTMGIPIANQIGHQMKDGSIDNITGTKFGCWAIWRKQLKQRTDRNRRQIEGSGENDEFDDDDYNYDDDTLPENETEFPASNGNGSNTTISTTLATTVSMTKETSTILPTPTHAHRHHHGDQDEETTTLANEPQINYSTTVSQPKLEITSASTIQSSQPNATTPASISTDYVELIPENSPPMIKTRLQKFAVTSGKLFTYLVPVETFFDPEDKTNLRLQMSNKDGQELSTNSWLQFNTETHEIVGLPLDDAVSRWQYRLTATDSGNESVTEIMEMTVQQHRGVRSVNHEINIVVQRQEGTLRNIDWQIKLVKAIATVLGENNTDAIVVREVRQFPTGDANTATFVYFNETLPTSKCPENELTALTKTLQAAKLQEHVLPTLKIKQVTGQLIGACQKQLPAVRPKPTSTVVKNVPPQPRNQVDRVNATAGHLLVYKVPSDTFYDDHELTLTLRTKENRELSTRHWLQFDSKNQEFYGIPKSIDIGTEEYLLVAENSLGLSANDALVVVVSHAPKREYIVYFKAYLGIRHEQFNADLQRKFVERIASLFGDPGAQYIQIRSVTTQHDADSTIVNFYNTTLYKSHHRCPEAQVEAARSVYVMPDNSVRERVKQVLGPELNLTNLQIHNLGSCHGQTDIGLREYPTAKADVPTQSAFGENYMITIVYPAVIIVTMIIIASLIACCIHKRRRKSGKMELGDEEERKSFRTKGIPVIFQDELDEKPEIGNKSPIIMKDEKPPLLPPSYNTSNMNGDNDVDEYVPPPAVIVGGREVRGKSPATPSYRKPPPYVSP